MIVLVGELLLFVSLKLMYALWYAKAPTFSASPPRAYFGGKFPPPFNAVRGL